MDKANHSLVRRAGLVIEHPLFNALWFDLAWFSLVVGRESLIPLSLFLLAFHLFLVSDKIPEYCSLVFLGGIGIGVDCLLSITGILVFTDGWLIPWWLACLWIAFSATLSRSLKYFSDKPFLAIILGAIAGPVSYWAGFKLGAVSFGYSTVITLLLLSVIWSVLLPTLLGLAMRCPNSPKRCLV